jgi:hypothetical protein
MSAQLTHEKIPATTTEPAAVTTEPTATATGMPAPASRGVFGRVWHRMFLAFREINYANRRIVEVQAPWIVDEQRHRR